MFVWGSTVHGELGVGGVEDEHILVPQKLDWVESQNVVSTALGDNHTLLLTSDGKIYSCGDNDYGQLGHEQPRKRPQLVSGLDAHFMVAVACGKAHSLALNKWGHVFAWGSDSSGQLGHDMGQTIQPVPKIVKSLAKYHIVQIACGRLHSVALSNSGDILCWGANSFGEVGNGHMSIFEPSPVLLTSLRGIPFSLISCGSHHTFVLSKSGAVFGWGKNIQGQLGLNDNKNKAFPCHLRTLRSIKVRYMDCGEDYSTFLTLDGGVFSCGSGSNGQLGHGTTSNEILPKQIFELMGSTITQISCGRKHTLAFVPSGGRVYSFGVGGSGQLGLRKITNTNTPQVVKFPWLSATGTVSSVPSSKSEKYDVQRVFAGGDRSIVLVKKNADKSVPFDCRCYDKATQIEQVDVDYMYGYLNCNNDTTVDQDFMTYLEVVFKSLQCLNGSFLLSNNAHYWCTSKHHGVDMELAEKCFSVIGRYENDTIKELIWNCIVEDIVPNLSPSPPDVETLRIYLSIPLYHEFNNPKQHLKLHKPFASALLKLGKNASQVVGGWWRMMTAEYFEKLANIFKSVVSFILRGQKIPERETVFYDSSLEAMLDILSFLNKLNHLGDGFKVPYDTFHLSDLSDYVDVRMDYALWLNETNTGKLFLCNYPFIFDAPAKTLLLETDQSFQMHNAMQNAAKEAFISMLLQPSIPMSVNQFLVLNVHRDHLVDDALRELSSVTSKDLKKPLKVKFFGEEAEDAGGVSKEFFLLLLREILDPKYGMFKEYEETRSVWFSDNSFENGDVYLLIGMICGLAIYNFTIINIPFPLALYKKLLEEPIGLADMKGLSPTVYNSLQAILDYQLEDLGEVFGLNFEISKDVYGEITSVPLKPNGSNITVTQENKQEYVDLYIDYVFNTSVEKEYSAFHEGFMKVCGGRVLKLFHSHELMAVVIGNENYDWHALEEQAEYKNGFESSSQTIRWFWEVLHDMSLPDKKKFLLFLTGSDRIPIQGMKAIKIIIQKTNDEKYLPVAHTCFNLLDLPEYKTKERLRYKLMQAIQQNEGFSLV